MTLCLTFQDKLCISTGIVSLLLLELSEQFQSLADIRFLLAIGRCEDFHNICRCNLSISLCLECFNLNGCLFVLRFLQFSLTSKKLTLRSNHSRIWLTGLLLFRLFNHLLFFRLGLITPDSSN